MKTQSKKRPLTGHSRFNPRGQNRLTLPFAILPLLFLAITATALLGSCASEANPEDTLQEKKDAVMATIEEETNAFFARDYDRWKATYIQEEYAFQAWSNRDGTFDSSVGWDAIDNSIGLYITDNPIPEAGQATTVERKNIRFKFYGDDVAYLTWDQFNSDRNGELFFHSKEVRLLERVGNEWKIVCVSAFWDFKNLIPAEKLPEIQRMDKEQRGTDKI